MVPHRPDHPLKRQEGMTLIGWVIVLAIIGFFTLLAIRLVPLYLEYYSVKGALHSLEEEPFITKKSKRKILDLIDRRLFVNGVQNADVKDFHVEKKDGKLKVWFDYEVVRPFIGNVYLLVKFHDEIEIVAH
ncbi:MAG: DUF4845 domain-containing protein [Gammaproteobacteria bacterium]|nr:MAG: DUF4845 domain-containing protein [Gammaproteobacteria bacterium]